MGVFFISMERADLEPICLFLSLCLFPVHLFGGAFDDFGTHGTSQYILFCSSSFMADCLVYFLSFIQVMGWDLGS